MSGEMSSGYDTALHDLTLPALAEAEATLLRLAEVFFQDGSNPSAKAYPSEVKGPNIEERYRALVEQIPAIVFMAYLDRGIGEAYVSPQIEEKLGFTQREWLEDPVRWYQQIHPKDKDRWSLEAANVFLTGKPLRSAYRVISRDGRVLWFHCEAKLMRREDGRPWFMHGVAFDITELKKTEEALQNERNVVSAIFDTVGALVIVMDPAGRIARFNRACEQATGYSFEEVKDRYVWDLFTPPEKPDRFRIAFERLHSGQPADDYETNWLLRDGTRRLIAWSSTVLPGNDGKPSFIIATGIDITEKKRLEKSILEVSGREQRRIGQDLHDGLGQHLTGIAFLAKVQEQNLAAQGLVEAAAAGKIVRLVNEAIYKTRELSRGLHPVLSEPNGLVMALQQLALEVEDVFHVPCRFEVGEDLFIYDENVATHLFRIGQEAVHNAIKHARPNHIRIVLSSLKTGGALTVTDNGRGLPADARTRTGMGLNIMNYRAGMIGGSLEVERRSGGGTRVTCTFPLRASND
jgi:PAS domain S-box-containing protein